MDQIEGNLEENEVEEDSMNEWTEQKFFDDVPENSESATRFLEEDNDEELKPASVASGVLEKRPSIVSATELATSPGGSNRLQVDLKRPQSRKESERFDETPPGANENSVNRSNLIDYSKQNHPQKIEPHDESNTWAVSEEYDNVGTESFHWKQQTGYNDEVDPAVAEKLANDMEKAIQNDDDGEYFFLEKPIQKINSSSSKIVSPSNSGKQSNNAIDGNSFWENLVEEKNRQIDSLQQQLMQALRGDTAVIAEIDSSNAVDTRDSKIVELAKKNRGLSLSLSKERDRCSHLEKSLKELESTLKRYENKLELSAQGLAQCTTDFGSQKLKVSGTTQETDSSDQHDKIMQEKVNELQQKIDNLRRKWEIGKSECKKLKRALSKEVGEGSVLDKLLSEIHSSAVDRFSEERGDEDFGSWRGRAQKIVLLQSKVKRLQTQLEKQQDSHARAFDERSGLGDDVDGISVFGEDDGLRNSPLKSVKRKKNVDSKAEDDIRFIEQERRHAMEKLAHEYERLENELGESKRTMNAVKSRSKVLENENKRYKDQVKILLNKTKNDDTLVDALRREVDRLKAENQDHREKLRSLEKGSTDSIILDEMKQHAQSQSAQIERQSQLLVKMRSELERVKASASREIVDRANDDIDTQTSAVNAKLLRVENERLGELVELFRKKLEQAVLDRETTLTKCKLLEKSKIELERKLGNIRAGGMKRQPMADQFSELKDKLALQIEENRAVRSSAAQTIAQKDEEIRILREMGMEVKQTYERAISEMKRQVAATAVEAQKRISHTETRIDDALLSQLTRDNEYLRDELQVIRHRTSGGVLSPSQSKSLSALDSPQLRTRRVKHAI